MLPENYIDQIKAEYPKRLGHHRWETVRTLVPRLVFTWKVSWETILKGVRNYRLMMEQTGKVGTQYVMAAERLFNDQDRLVCEYADMDMRPPAQVAADAKLATLQARANALGVQVAGMDSRAAEEAIVQAERAALNRKWEQAGMNQPKFAVVK